MSKRTKPLLWFLALIPAVVILSLAANGRLSDESILAMMAVYVATVVVALYCLRADKRRSQKNN